MQVRKIILFSVLVLSIDKLQAADANPFLSKSENPNPFLNVEHSKSVCDNCKKLQDMLDCEKANRKKWFFGGVATVVMLYLGRGQIGKGLVVLGDSLRGERKVGK